MPILFRTLRTVMFAIALFATNIVLFEKPVNSAHATLQTLSVEVRGEAHSLEILVAFPGAHDQPHSEEREPEQPTRTKFPVALFTHGAPGFGSSAKTMDTSLMSAWVRSFAARGYLAVAVMRRGYGRSSGQRFVDMGTCENPDPTTYLDGHADDLEAALAEIATWPAADMSQVIGFGHSTGGMTMLTLAAHTDPTSEYSLRAVVNIAGGLYRIEPGTGVRPFAAYEGCERYAEVLIDTMASLSPGLTMPTLWLYAENDPFFRPPLVRRLHRAWEASGGMADLVFMPPYEPDGHRLFVQTEGQAILLPRVDEFLRKNGLPTWDLRTFDDLSVVLDERYRHNLHAFLHDEVSNKALAMPLDGAGLYWTTNFHNSEAARIEALARCREETGAECRIILENFGPTSDNEP